MRQILKVSGITLFLFLLMFSTDAVAQRGKKRKKAPRNYQLEKKLIGTWSAQGSQAFVASLTFRAGNQVTQSSMAGEQTGTYVVRGRKLIVKALPPGAPAGTKKRKMKYRIVSINGNILTVKNKSGVSTFAKQ
jgi:hypothetical protein